jgi:hypothetical protein
VLWDDETKTGTKYYTYNGSGTAHPEYQAGLGGPGTDCMLCHKHAPYEFGHEATIGSDCDPCHGHDEGYVYEPEEDPSQGTGTVESHSVHTEDDGDDLKGPFGDCGACHDIGNYPTFKSGIVITDDGYFDLEETDICDNCHSPDGAYDGVTMAKDNWKTGVYDSQFEVLPYWQGNTPYETGDIILYKPDAVTQAYVAQGTFTSKPDSPDGSNWKLIDDWQGDPSIEYYLGDLVLFNDKVFRSRFTHVSSEPVNPLNWDLVERTGAGTESLLPGNEKWCASCHDDEPANSRMDGLGVYAPNVIGDEVLGVDSSYGFYVSGHGRLAIGEMAAIEKECLDCHTTQLSATSIMTTGLTG